jgi:hypothetical protein
MKGATLFFLIAMAVASVLAQTPSTAAFVVPKFGDLTVKKRHSFGADSSNGTTEVLYLKDARERHEFFHEVRGSKPLRHAFIVQCDERRSVQLNPETKIYSVAVLEDWSGPSRRGRPMPEGKGADVTTTIDAVDTGERRPAGHYTARRVRTTVTVESNPGANTRPSTTKTDGWYIDLPGLGCSNDAPSAYLITEVAGPGGLRDRHHYQSRGTARRGYAIEETIRSTRTGRTDIERVELIELSEQVLDQSLFDIPSNYEPALPLVGGGFNMTKPDTLANRLQGYWDEILAFAIRFSSSWR